MSEPRGADSVLMSDAVRVDLPAARGTSRSPRLLRLAGDDRLVAQIRRGSEAAFEVAFERHGPGVLSFCRHMLGSPEEAEDAVQHAFAAAYRALQRSDAREIALKPWLFTIARNRCLSILRARREVAHEPPEIATAGLAEQVERRAELRELLADIHELPDEQRAALLLAEVAGLPHADIATVLDCEAGRVKALVYRARSALIARREARELPCERIREQLAELRGGSLRRTELRLHLRECPSCRDFREQVKRQRQMMAIALPVAPTLGLKSSVLAAVGIGGGAAAGGGAVIGGASLVGVAKVAAVTLIAGGGTAVVVEQRDRGVPEDGGRDKAVAPIAPQSAGGAPAAEGPMPTAPAATPGKRLTSHGEAGNGHAQRPTHGKERAPGQLKTDKPAKQARPAHSAPKGRPTAPNGGNGRGPIEAPPKNTPVRRGPPEPKVKQQSPAQAPEPRGKANGIGGAKLK